MHAFTCPMQLNQMVKELPTSIFVLFTFHLDGFLFIAFTLLSCVHCTIDWSSDCVRFNLCHWTATTRTNYNVKKKTSSKNVQPNQTNVEIRTENGRAQQKYTKSMILYWLLLVHITSYVAVVWCNDVLSSSTLLHLSQSISLAKHDVIWCEVMRMKRSIASKHNDCKIYIEYALKFYYCSGNENYHSEWM